EPAVGSVYLDVGFEHLSLLRKLGTLPAARIGGVLLISLFGAFLMAGAAWSAKRGARSAESSAVGAPRSALCAPRFATWQHSLKRDFVLGAGSVFTAGLVVGIYLLGASGALEAGWTALGVAVAGAVLAEWWKFGLTGKHLTAGEVFRDMFVSGLLAA